MKSTRAEFAAPASISFQSLTGKYMIKKSVLCRSSGDSPGRACCDKRHAKHQRHSVQLSHLQHCAQDCSGRARHDRLSGWPPGALPCPLALATSQQALLCRSKMPTACMLVSNSQRLCGGRLASICAWLSQRAVFIQSQRSSFLMFKLLAPGEARDGAPCQPLGGAGKGAMATSANCARLGPTRTWPAG